MFSIIANVLRALLFGEDESDAKENVKISGNFIVGLQINERKSVVIGITNVSRKMQVFNKLVLEQKHDASTILTNMSPEKTAVNIAPGQSISLTIECYCKQFGKSEVSATFNFVGFKIAHIFQLKGAFTLPSILNYNTAIERRVNVKPPTSNQPSILNYNTANDRRVAVRPSTSKQLSSINCTPSKLLTDNSRGYDSFFLTVRSPTDHSGRSNWHHEGIPKQLWQMYYDHADESTQYKLPVPPILLQPLSIDNYVERFRMLVYLEEIEKNVQYKKYKMQNVSLVQGDESFYIEIKGVAEMTPTLQFGDFIVVDNLWNQSPPQLEGFINAIEKNSVHFRLPKIFNKNYKGENLKIEFFACRSPYKKCYTALKNVFNELGPKILFPNNITGTRQPQINSSTLVDLMDNMVISEQQKRHNISWFNNKINDVQKQAVINILNGTLRPMPYVIYGPPGTGKTLTLIETIMQIATLRPKSKLLITAPSNTAADLITQNLIDASNSKENYLIRVVSNAQVSKDKVPSSLQKFSATIKTSKWSTSEIDKKGFYHNCEKAHIVKHQIVIGTCTGVEALNKIDIKAGYFTHILIDEAGQCTEPDIMITFCFVDKWISQVILAGDPQQLGPVVLSNVASKHGLNESYLERLLSFAPYQRDVTKRGTTHNGYNPHLVTMLIYNFRSIPKIVSLFSDVFYEGCLIAELNDGAPLVTEYFNRIKRVLKLIHNPGVIFYGIKGNSLKGVDEPSWYNPEEANALLTVLKDLYTRNITEGDIGIITPYNKQVAHITKMIKSKYLPLPKVGSVDIFQGQERKIIMMSTVRSQNGDSRSKQMGFVKSPKRINVAFSRAQILLIIFGDPHLLVHDPIWKMIITRIVNNHMYIGCNLPLL